MARLLDQYGNPVDLGALRHEAAGPTVTGVRPVVSGHPAQGLTPARLTTILREAEAGDPMRYLELAEEMEEKDLHYRSVIATRKLQVAGLEVTVDAASDAADDVRAADLVRAWLDRDALADEVFDILDAIGKGFSVTEIVWDTSGRDWMPARLEWRDPRWFDFDPIDGRTLRLRTETGPQPLAPYQFITHIAKSKSGLPIRGGLARVAAWVFLFKTLDIKSWVGFAEIFGIPLRLGRYGPGASETDKQTLLRAVRNIAGDAAAIIPEGMQIEFIEAKLSGNIDLFEKFAGFLDRQVSKAVLGQTGTTDTGQHVGTANAHERVREDIETADARQLAATLNRDLVRPLIDLNLGPRRAYPRLRIARRDAVDLDGLVGRVEKLVPLGLRVERSWMADQLGIPDPDEGAELLGKVSEPLTPTPLPQGERGLPPPPALPPPARARALPSPLAGEGARSAGEGADTDALDGLTDAALEGWVPVMTPMVDPILALARSCASYDELLARLPELAERMDVGPLADLLGRAVFVARLHGETEDLTPDGADG